MPQNRSRRSANGLSERFQIRPFLVAAAVPIATKGLRIVVDRGGWVACWSLIHSPTMVILDAKADFLGWHDDSTKSEYGGGEPPKSQRGESG